MASGWNLCMWLECIGVVSGWCCKEVFLNIFLIYFLIKSLCKTNDIQ